MSDAPPIELVDVCQLASLGINPQSFNFLSTTLESDHYVCCRETSDAGNAAVIVDLKNNNQVTKKSMSADSVIMHPNSMVISLRANDKTIQIFNMETKQRLKSNEMNERIVFWKWLSDQVLGLVTLNSIYTWNVFDGTDAGPILLTSRHVSLNDCQITQFAANKSLNWFAIGGIAQENGRIVGHIQLFSKDRNISQPIEGHVANFTQLKLQGSSIETQLFAFATRNENGGTLHINEIDHQEGAPVITKKNVDIFFPSEVPNDFPVAIQLSSKYGIAYILTKFGFIHLYDVETGKKIFLNRISSDPVFTGAPFDNNGGIITINRSGSVLAVEISTDRIIPYILNNLGDVELALSLASRGNLPGAENLFSHQFNQSIATGDYTSAVRIAASSSQLRTPDTIAKLKSLPTQQGQPAPFLQYLVFLLDRGTLNKFETLELVKPLVQQNRIETLEKYLKENKLECSEELGDLIKPANITLALAVYYKSNVPNKVVQCLAELGQFDKILPFCEKVSYTPNFTVLIQNILRVNPDKAAEFAVSLLQSQPDLNVQQIADIFFSQNYIQQATAFLLDALKEDKPADGQLQTKLLEVNLLHAPQVADAILGNSMFTHYDRPTIAALCEKAGLYQRALELYDNIKDIKRVIVHANELPADWLVSYFGNLKVDQSVSCLREMLSNNLAQNLQVAIQLATRYSELIGPVTLIKVFEDYKSTEGLYYYLSSIVNVTQEPEVVLKYIQCAAKLGQIKEIERVVRDNNVYDGEKVKNFLKEAQLQDQLPLIVVCDRYDFVHDLILYLYKNKFFKFIEVYVQQVNPSKTPQVVAALLDVDCDENIIKSLLKSVLGQVPIAELCEEVEKRNRLKILLPFLEDTLASGSQDKALVDQVVGTAIPELEDPQPISIAVKAFMDNQLQSELIDLLEKIVLEPSPFNDNPSLQALLILTAVKVDPSRISNYIEKMDAYNPDEVAPICIENQLYEEAFQIYDKFENHTAAMKVLVEDIMSLDKGEEYAEKLEKPEIWSQLAEAQLNGLRIPESIDSYLKAEDPSNYANVIEVAEHAGKEEELIPFLLMARKTLREPLIDGAIINAYATLNRLSDIEKFLKLSNVADLDSIGDKLYQNGNYEAAKLVFESVSNYSKLASTLVYLKDYTAAVDCARKASNVSVWKQVNQACIENKEFKLAQMCGLHLIVHAEELEPLVIQYEYNGYFNELISLFENGLSLERAHMGMFTELANLYTKYQPDKTMEHLKLFWSRINIPKVIRACEEAHLWPELIFLYCHYDEWDNAALTMIERSESAFDHSSFKEIIVKVSNLEIYYRAINFYTNMHPTLLIDLLAVLTPRLDLPRVVKIFQKSDNLPLIKPFLISVLEKNNSVVNSAYHDLLIEEEDYKSLRLAIESYDKFDHIGLAERLEKHELIFFRQLAAIIYRNNKKYNKAISLLKSDGLWSDAIETAAMSKSTKIITELLTYFVETGNRECMVATLYRCYSYIDYDVVLELSWLNNLEDLTKPYQISVARENQKKINEVYSDLKLRQEKEKTEEEPSGLGQPLMITSGPSGSAPLNVNSTGMGFGNGGF
ncbi:Clathrin heavy chain [Pichia kudriavzevii]|uniref:Clathrin heavy chain n=1 Tax=Pichia kudriavzevii TaxID=4909 RepID=A0A1V2LKU7_PICKU|nr:Clathrin heavy chain [Pichia kudriavzevii]